MALGVKKIFQHYDFLSLNELRNFIVHLVAGDPGAPVDGQMWTNTSTNRLKTRLNGVTKTLAHTDELGGGGTVTGVTGTAPITSTGGITPDIAINAASGAAAGSMSAAHYTLVNDSTAAATASTVVRRDASSRFAAANPSAGTDVANKDYVDATAAGVRDVKDSVRVAATANVSLANGLENGDTIDGVTIATGDRVLLPLQSTGAENGIYVAVASGAASRSTDADTSAEVNGGLYVWVNEGTANADSGWLLTTNDPITLNTTALVFTQVSGLGQVTAGGGVGKSGNTLTWAAGFGMVQETDGGAIDKTLVSIFKEGLVGGAGPDDEYTIPNPGFVANRRIKVEIIEEATGETVTCGVARDASGNIVVNFGGSSVAGTDFRYLASGYAA